MFHGPAFMCGSASERLAILYYFSPLGRRNARRCVDPNHLRLTSPTTSAPRLRGSCGAIPPRSSSRSARGSCWLPRRATIMARLRGPLGRQRRHGPPLARTLADPPTRHAGRPAAQRPPHRCARVPASRYALLLPRSPPSSPLPVTPPADGQRPISQWTSREIAAEITHAGDCRPDLRLAMPRGCSKGGSQTAPDPLLAHAAQRRAVRRQGRRPVYASIGRRRAWSRKATASSPPMN